MIIMAITRTSKTRHTSTQAYHKRHLLSKHLLLSICSSAASVIDSFKGNYIKTPRNNSKLTATKWINEILHGHPERFRSAFGLSKHVFERLKKVLMWKGGLQDLKHLKAEEQLAIFLYLSRTGLSIRLVGERFQRSNETVSMYVLPSAYCAGTGTDLTYLSAQLFQEDARHLLVASLLR